VDDLARRLEHGEEGPGDVLGVDQRSPRAAVALESHLAAGERRAGEVVHDDVGPQTRRRAVGGGVAQVGGAQAVAGELGDARLGHDLALAVGRHGMELGVLVEPSVAAGPVERARGGEQVTRDAGGPGDTREVDGAVRVDRVRGRGVQVPDRVVREGGQVDDRVEAGDVVGAGVADVAGPLLVAGRDRPEVAPVVPPGVEADDLVAGPLEERDHHGAEVTPVAGHEYPHGHSPYRRGPTARRALNVYGTDAVRDRRGGAAT
jgi:hypothetical protein